MPERRINTPIPPIPSFVWGNWAPTLIWAPAAPTITALVARRFTFGGFMWYHINILVNNATGAPVTDLIVDDMPALAAYGAPGQALQWAGGIFAGASATGIAGGTDILENLGGWAPLADGDNGIYILEGFYEV